MRWRWNPDEELRNLEQQVLIDPYDFELRSRLANLYRRLGYSLEISIAPLIDPLIQRLTTHPRFDEIIAIVNLYTSGGQTYLVGGKVYRNLIELLHFLNVKAETKDWDFLFLGIPHRNPNTRLPEGWKEVPFYRGDYTIRLHHKKSGLTIDIISIFDSAELIGEPLPEVETLIDNQQYQEALEIYFEAVPLDVQAIALDLHREGVYGEIGLQSIFNLDINIKRPVSLLDWDIDPNKYLNSKLLSMNLPKKTPPPRPEPEPEYDVDYSDDEDLPF